MKKTTKIWLVIAASLVLLGSIVFVGVMSMLKWDFTKLSTGKYETNHYEINEDYKNISIVTDTADIVIIPSENLKTSVICHEPENMKHAVMLKDDTLVIEVIDTRKWYEYIGINFGGANITVYIPQEEYGWLSVRSDTGDVEISKDFTFESIDIQGSTGNVAKYASALKNVTIKLTTGNIGAESITVDELDLSVSTGGIRISNVTCQSDVKINVSTGKASLTNIACKNVISRGNTGDIFLKTVIAAEGFLIKRSTGDVKFDECDAAEIFVETDTGEVVGSLNTDKVFIAETSTGRIDVPNTTTGGRCEIITSTGNIKIDVTQP